MDVRDYIPINWTLISSPVNWVIVVLMISLALLALSAIFPAQSDA